MAVIKADVKRIEDTQTGVYNALSPRFSGYATDTKYEMHMFSNGDLELYPPESKLNIFGLTGIQGQAGLDGATGVQGIQGPTGVQGTTGLLGTDFEEGGFTGTSYGITDIAYPYVQYTMLKNKVVNLKIPPFSGVAITSSYLRIDNMPTGIEPSTMISVACPTLDVFTVSGVDYFDPVNVIFYKPQQGDYQNNYCINFSLGYGWPLDSGGKGLNNTISISYIR